MTNRDRVLALLLEQPGLSDREIRERSGISPHQQVNQITNQLAAAGQIDRVREGGVYRNYPRGQAAQTPDSPVRGRPDPSPMPGPGPSEHRRERADWRLVVAPGAATLLVLPCSARKRRGGTEQVGPSIVDHLPAALGEELRERRNAVVDHAADPDRLMPAKDRYAGGLYQAAGDALSNLTASGTHLVIISGGYGVVLGDEPIAWYDAPLERKGWPFRIIPRCLEAAASALKADRVIALAGTSTPYAHVIRQARWPVDAILLTPVTAGGGAMRRTPRAIGEAVRALAGSELHAGWTSSDGVALRQEKLT